MPDEPSSKHLPVVELEMSETDLEKSAMMVLWFEGLVQKFGKDKRPTDPVGIDWLDCPLTHLTPDEAMAADWDPKQPLMHVGYAARVGLDPGEVLEFSYWWDDIGSVNEACRLQIERAMGHDRALEEPFDGPVKGDDDG